MKNKIKKFLSFVTAIVITLGVIIPSASFVHAATTLEVAQYTKTSGVVTGVTASNNGTYEGKWSAEIPMGKVMAGKWLDLWDYIHMVKTVKIKLHM